MALPTKVPRDKAITIRISVDTYKRLNDLAERHNLSQADIFEALVAQEYEEGRRLKGKRSRRARN